jgi:hypothetical protein
MVNVVRIPLTRGYYTLIDEADAKALAGGRWHVQIGRNGEGKPYAAKVINKQLMYLHRHLLAVPANLFVDHINGDTLDNRRSNLRICSASENQRNQRKAGWKGVYRAKPRTATESPRYYSAICYREKGNRRYIRLGYFDTALEAAKAYNQAALNHYGKYACLNDLSVMPLCCS